MSGPTETPPTRFFRPIMLLLGFFATLALLWFVISPGLCHSGKETRAEADLSALKSALAIFSLDAGRYPTTEEGLAALIEEPKRGLPLRHWRRQLDREVLDPWGHPYRYESENGGRRITLRSLGPDGVVSADDQTIEVENR